MSERISILDWGPESYEPPAVENEEEEWPWMKGPPKSVVEKCRELVQEEIAQDAVNSPSHYGTGSIECIDYIEDFLTTEEFIGYLRGNIAKYLHRWRYKNQEEDLLKAQWYLNRLIDVKQKTPKVYYQEG